MKCDPKTLSLIGLHGNGDIIEEGNHLRWFVGVEKGYPIDEFRICRRPAQEKLNWIKRLLIPVDKNDLFDYFRAYPLTSEKEIEITADDNLTIIPSTVRFKENNFLDFTVRFPSVVSYLRFELKREKTLRSWIRDFFFKSPDKTVPRSKNTSPVIKSKSWKPVYKYETSGISNKTSLFNTLLNILARLSQALIGTVLPSPEVTVVALYDGELVKEYKFGRRKALSVVNVPTNEIRLRVPKAVGLEIQFLLMEEDCLAGSWADVELLETPQKLLQILNGQIDADPKHEEKIRNEFFLELIKRRFWHDVDNRYLKRKFDATIQPLEDISDSLKTIYALYGRENFHELAQQVNNCYSKGGSIYRTIFGQESVRDWRRYEWSPVRTLYDPKELGFLLLLSMDINIATILSLHCVDRGQSTKYPDKTADPREYAPAHYRTDWDYRVVGQWAAASDKKLRTLASVYYDVSPRKAPALEAPEIVKHETLEGIGFVQPPDGIIPSPPENHRLFRVGLKWDIQMGYDPFAPTAFDVYGDGKLLETDFINKEEKIEKISPFTPPRAKEEPQKWIRGTKNIRLNASLPRLPPFSKVSEVKGAGYTYVDVSAPLGERIYHIESVDIFGRYTDEKKQIKHDVRPAVPVPAPINIKAELIKKQNPDRFAIVARWGWGRMQRLLAPDLDRFEVFWHMGRHNLEMPGLMVWVSETGAPEQGGPSKLHVELLLRPGPLAAIVDIPNLGGFNLILRCEGRKYALDNVQVTSTGSSSNFTVTGEIETKQRKIRILITDRMENSKVAPRVSSSEKRMILYLVYQS